MKVIAQNLETIAYNLGFDSFNYVTVLTYAVVLFVSYIFATKFSQFIIRE